MNRLKKMLALFLALAMILPGIPVLEMPVFAATETSGVIGDCVWELTVTESEEGTERTLTIQPKEDLAEAAMADLKTSVVQPWGRAITSVVIQGGVTNLGYAAFYGCASLENITFDNNGDSLKTIGGYALSLCSKLTSIVIPEGVEVIEKYAFNNSNLREGVILPETLTSIGTCAFRKTKIGEITIPTSVATIGENAFYACGSLTKAVIGAGTIAEEAFLDCVNLETLTFSGTKLTSIGVRAFKGCTALKGCLKQEENTEFYDLEIPAYYNAADPNNKKKISQSISNSAFEGCTSLTSVTLGKTMTSIGSRVFYGCSNLSQVVIDENNAKFSAYKEGENDCCIIEKNTIEEKDADGNVISTERRNILFWCFQGYQGTVTVPTTVDIIGELAFLGSNVTSITITENVKEIANTAFMECSNLVEFIVTKDNSYFVAEGGCLYNTKKDTLLFGTNLVTTFPNTVTKIGKYAFFGRPSLETITIPATVTEIDSHAFNDCTALESIVLPENGALTTLGDGVFAGCKVLDSIVIPKNVTEIGKGVFSGCAALHSLFVSANNSVYQSKNNCILTKDGTTVLFGCGGSTIPADVTVIGDYAFDNSNIAAVVIPDSVVRIGDFAFVSCTNLTEVVIPDSVREIGTRAFFGCTALRDVALPKSNVTLGSRLFSGCKSLLSVTLPKDLKTIDPWLFAEWRGLQRIAIPEGVETISAAAFMGCTGLTDIVLPSTIQSIEYGAFTNCTSLKGVWFCGGAAPQDVCSIENNYFSAAAKHYIDDPCDKTCNDCDDSFLGVHTVTTSSCDTECDHCGASVIGIIPHSYDTDSCDSTCNYCDYIRDTAHSYHFDSANARAICELCGETRACTGLTGECFYYLNGTELTIFGNGATANYTLSETAPWGAAGITSVIVEKGVTVLGKRSFASCDKLVSVSLPEGLELIDSRAFADCSSLKNITIPATVRDIGNEEEGCVFYNCKALTSIVLPEGLLNIYNSTFKGCTSLISIVIPGSIKTVYEMAFDGCKTSGIDVWYTGPEVTKSAIAIGADNKPLNNATWHYVSSACDSTCSACDELQVVEHAYYNDCDSVCNACGAAREVEDHIYDNACDVSCNICGTVREVGDHVYDHVCDADCNICGAVRDVGVHVYDNACDIDCNLCGTVREVQDHIYDNTCDTDCNECGAVRSIEHTYGGDCDDRCNVCGAERTASDNHVYDSVCDENCNDCGELRAAVHSFAGDCDGVCDACGETRTVAADHSYSDQCDAACDVCHEKRAVRHSYSSDCDEFCNNCKSQRTVFVAHSYSNVCDSECDVCGHATEAAPHSLSFDNQSGKIVCAECDFTEDCTGTTGDCYYYLDGTVLTIFGNGAMGAGYPWGQSITAVIIKEGVTSIGEKAFVGCKNLTSVVIPRGVKEIGNYAFASCTALTDVTLSAGVERIYTTAFSYCTNLGDVWFNGTQTQAAAIVWVLPEPEKDPVIDGNGSEIRPGKLPGGLFGSESGSSGDESASVGSVLKDATWHYTAIVGTNFSLHSSINAKLHVAINMKQQPENIAVRFTMHGNELVVTDYKISGGNLVFVFEGIAPQCMNDQITAELVIDGTVVDVRTFTVRTYCDNLLAMSAEDLGISAEKYAATKTMIVNLLNYGTKAQQYLDYKTDSPANKDFAEAQTAMETLEKENWANALGIEWNKVVGSSDGMAAFKSASVWFDNENRLYFKFIAPGIDETNFLVRITDETKGVSWDYSLSDFDVLANDTYGIFSEAISVSNFHHKFTVTLFSRSVDYKGEIVESAHQTVSNYGVYSYIYSMQNKQDANGLTNMALLARACYCYGVAANVYENTI